MNVFITAANAKKLEFNLDSDEARKLYIDDLYKLSLWMLSRREREWLAAVRVLYANPEFYIQRFYKTHVSDTNQSSDWVYIDQGRPAFHKDNSCDKLLSDYKNYKIPPEITHRGDEEKERFRMWFDENRMYLDRPQLFITRMENDFSLKNPPRIEEFEKANSGVEIIENLPLDDIQNRIDKQIAAMKHQRDRNPSIISEYGMQTHLVKKEIIKITDPGAKNVLDKWHKAKQDLKTDLRTYFKIRFNPDLEFQADLLKTVGFHACSSCASS